MTITLNHRKNLMNNSDPKILLISDQVMLKAANQVLFHTVRGLLEDGYCVCLILYGTTGHELENIASLDELFPEYLHKVEVHYFETFGSWGFELLRKLRSTFTERKKDISEISLESFPPSNAVTGFDKTRTGLTFLSDFKYELKWLAAYATAKKASRSFKPDLICGFEIGGAVPAEKLSKHLSIPFYTKYMGTIVHPYIIENRLQQVKPYLKGLKVKASLHFMSNDGTRGDIVQKYLGVDPDTIRFRIDGVKKYMSNGLPDRDQCASQLGLPIEKEDFLCLCLSNHNAGYKRLDRAIRAIGALSKKHQNIKLILVGDGSNTNALKALAYRVGPKNIIFLPKLKYQDIPFILKVADVYLNTNDVSNLSNTVLEAMACGSAVVSMDDGSLDGIVKHGETGLLVKSSGCETLLPEAIESLYYDYDLLKSLGNNAQIWAEKYFYTWDEKNRIELDEVRKLLY